MVKLAKKITIMLLGCLMAICAFFGIGIIRNDTQKALAETTATKTSVSGIQLRADVGSSQYYLVLNAIEYTSVAAGTVVSNPANYADLLSNITFYASAEDEGVSAKTLCNTDHWVINQWGSGGLMISMSAENYETYSGSSVYKVVLNEGAIMPYTATQDLRVSKTTEFINQNYGNEDAKYGSFVWTAIAANDYIDTSVTAFGDPGSENKDSLWFTLSTHDYATYNTPVAPVQLSALNWGSKIKITIGGVEKTLAEYNISSATLYKWARAGAPIVLTTSIADYTTIESITIEAGCEFPSQATANLMSGLTLYRTTKDVTFTNDGTGNFVLPNSYVDTSVTAFGDPGSENKDSLWFTLSTHDYATYNTPVAPVQLSALNWGSKIKITIGGVEKTLAEYNISSATLYKWARAGAPIVLTTSIADYTTIESITIEAGCEFPSQATADRKTGFTLYRTTEDITFINDGTGRFILPNSYIDTAVTVFGDPGFTEGVASENSLWFTLSNHDYVTGNNPVNATQLAALNCYSKIKFTIGGVEKSLGDYNVEAVCLNKWTRMGEPIAFHLSNFDYREIDSITIEAGCEFPSEATATKESGGGYTVYRTTEDITFYNDGTGVFVTLAAAQEIAKAELAAYKNAADYRETEQAAIASILETANTAINACETISAINETVATAKVELDALKTDAEYTAEEFAAALAVAKETAKADIASYKNVEDYRETEQLEIASVLEEANTRIDNAADVAAVETIVSETKATLDALKTDAEYTAEEAAAALATAKETAKADLAAYKNADDYRTAEQAQLAAILETANAAIDACENEESINAVVVSVKTELDALKTDAEYTEEENANSSESTSDSEEDSVSESEDDSTPDSTSESKEDSSSEPESSATDSVELFGCFGSVSGVSVTAILLFASVVLTKKKKEN